MRSFGINLLRTMTNLRIRRKVFDARNPFIPDLPKQPYRHGVGVYEGVVAHSTATPEAPAINTQKYESRT